MAIFMWVYGSFSPFAGVIADKLSRKWLVVGSLFVWSAVTLSMGFATNFETLYVLRALMGISEALYIPSALALITDWHTGKSRSLAIGVHMTACTLAKDWWIWRQFSSPFLMALHLFRPWFDRRSLFVGVDVLAS